MNKLEKTIDDLGMLELYSYPQKDQKKFWEIYKADMPKQLKYMKLRFPEESDIDLMCGIIEGVDIDKTLQYGEIKE